MKKVLLLAIALSTLAGCASQAGNNAPATEKRYITGSNIPMQRLQRNEDAAKDDLIRAQGSGFNFGTGIPMPRRVPAL